MLLLRRSRPETELVMNTSSAAWFVIAFMALAANVPFFTESVFGIYRLKQGKSFAIRLLELLVLYFLMIGFARVLESMAGNAFPQAWQFYTVTICLMLVLAFPGFVWRHLRKRQSAD